MAIATRRSRRSARTQDAPEAPAVPASVEQSEPVQVVEPLEFVENVVVLEPAAPAEATAQSVDGDAFDAAARLFSFTGETPVQAAQASADTQDPAAGGQEQDAAPTVTRTTSSRAARGASFRRVTTASFSFGVMGIVGLLAVGLTTPAAAVGNAGTAADISAPVFAAPHGDIASGASADAIQAYVTPAEVQSAAIDRPENYSTITMAQLAADSGISNFSSFFINNPNSPIQWPFSVGVPISYGFGMRDGTMHEGADFTPGEGSPIQAIADGVVRESTDSGGAFGVHIVIDHIIDGQLVSSSYSHMQYGSREVEVGQHVTVGTIVGHTGNTGRSFGAHTHFEILMNGTTPIDPIPWLRAHAGG
jgi:murein DD-endopeptidase MepM/ murein hydrolase activator NlpD